MDWTILAYLLREKRATSQQLSEHFNRSRRTINKHITKLENLHLVERHGQARCPFQWYSIPRENEALVAILVRKLKREFVAGRTYIVFTVPKNQASLPTPNTLPLPFQVPASPAFGECSPQRSCCKRESSSNQETKRGVGGQDRKRFNPVWNPPFRPHHTTKIEGLKASQPCQT